MKTYPIRKALVPAVILGVAFAVVVGCAAKRDDTGMATDTSTEASTDTPMTNTPQMPDTQAPLTNDQKAQVQSTFDQTATTMANCTPAMTSPSGALQALAQGMSANRSVRRTGFRSSLNGYFRPTSRREDCVSALSSSGATLGSYGDMGIFSLQTLVRWLLVELRQWLLSMFQGPGFGQPLSGSPGFGPGLFE